MKDLIVRFAQGADVDRIVELCGLHAEFEKTPYRSVGKKERLNESLFTENPALNCLVAVRNDSIVGYATYMKQYSTWDAGFYMYMDCLFITEESRGFGIGEHLIDRIKEEGRKEGCNLIQWQTPDFNQRAMKFYDRIGASSKSKERYFLNF